MWRMKRWVIWTALPFIILGLVFIIVGTRTDPAAKTSDGYSLKWFWYIMGAWFIGLTVLVYGGIFAWVGRKSRKAGRLQKNGRRGFATIMNSGATGGELNNMPQVEMELQVDVEGLPSYALTHREYVNPVDIPALQAGSKIPVIVDPRDPHDLMIDWLRQPGGTVAESGI